MAISCNVAKKIIVSNEFEPPVNQVVVLGFSDEPSTEEIPDILRQFRVAISRVD